MEKVVFLASLNNHEFINDKRWSEKNIGISSECHQERFFGGVRQIRNGSFTSQKPVFKYGWQQGNSMGIPQTKKRLGFFGESHPIRDFPTHHGADTSLNGISGLYIWLILCYFLWTHLAMATRSRAHIC